MMKKKIIISILAGSMLLAGAGCKKFLDVNNDPAAAANVTDALLLSGAELNTAFNITGGYVARTGTFWTQQLAYNLQGPDWDSYQVTSSDVDNTWSYDIYTKNLNNLKILDAQASEAGHFHYAGIAKVLTAYNLAVATDLWNDIPWSKGLTGFGSFKPSYDSQESIYSAIGTLLDDAIVLLQKQDDTPNPDKDAIYAGDATKWAAFAYFLKARYAMRLSYAPGKDKVAQAKLALDAIAKGFIDESQNPGVKFAGKAGSLAPWNQLVEIWGNICMASTLVDMLKAKKDPRLPFMADTTIHGTYVGRVIGGPQDDEDEVSALGKSFAAAEQTVFFGTYDEQLFIKAEATLLKDGFTEAQSILESAVKANMKRFGVDPNSPAAEAYIAANCTLTAANAYKVIMEEKYVSNFLSLETFNDWRRTNIPDLKVVEGAYQDITTVPRRWVYPASEIATNKQPQQPGILTDRVWWDAKP